MTTHGVLPVYLFSQVKALTSSLVNQADIPGASLVRYTAS